MCQKNIKKKASNIKYRGYRVGEVYDVFNTAYSMPKWQAFSNYEQTSVKAVTVLKKNKVKIKISYCVHYRNNILINWYIVY